MGYLCHERLKIRANFPGQCSVFLLKLEGRKTRWQGWVMMLSRSSSDRQTLWEPDVSWVQPGVGIFVALVRPLRYQGMLGKGVVHPALGVVKSGLRIPIVNGE